MTLNLINNVAFLIALVAIGQIVFLRFHGKNLQRQVLFGLLFGGVALLGMANPVNFAPGVFFDGRSIVLAVAGVVGGGVTAAIATGMAAFYRYQLGGIGAPVGIMIVLLSALLGVLARQWWLRGTRPPRPLDYFALGVVVQLVQLAAFTQVPDRAGYAFIEQAWWVLLLFYPVATMLLCMLFRSHEQQLIDKNLLQSAQDALVAEERARLQRFRAYFDHSTIGFAITSAEKGWLEVNDALCAALGYTRDELARMTWAQLTCPADLPADRAQFDRMLAGEINGYDIDKRFIHKDGHLVDTHLSVSLVRKPDGSVDYVVAVVEDLSERKLADEALRDYQARLARIVAVVPGVVYALRMRPDGSMTFPLGGARLAQDFGIPEARLAEDGAPWHALCHPDDAAGLMEAAAQSARALSLFLHEWRIRHPARGELWVEGRAVPQREPDGSTVWHGVMIDVTARKCAEEELKHRNAELERFNRVSVNRELDMIALKKRVNELSVELGRAPPCDLGAVNAAEAGAKR